MNYWQSSALYLAWFAVSSLGDVLINEIHYDPPIKTEHTEFIELYNNGSVAISLDGWQLTGAVDFTFPSGVSMPAGGYVVVAQDPAALRAKFGASALGPWQGILSNQGE